MRLDQIYVFSILAFQMKENPRRGPFTIVDYGAADGTNSLPLMTACHGKAELTFSNNIIMFPHQTLIL